MTVIVVIMLGSYTDSLSYRIFLSLLLSLPRSSFIFSRPLSVSLLPRATNPNFSADTTMYSAPPSTLRIRFPSFYLSFPYLSPFYLPSDILSSVRIASIQTPISPP